MLMHKMSMVLITANILVAFHGCSFYGSQSRLYSESLRRAIW